MRSFGLLIRHLKAVGAGILGAAMLSGVASAQTQPVPPEHYTVDPRGVSLVTGEFNYVTTEVVIGPPSAGGLAHTRQWLGEGQGWRDVEVGGVSNPGDLVVTTGLISETFVYNGVGWEPKYANGSTFEYVSGGYQVTDSKGNKAFFAYTSGETVYPYVALVSSETAPDGSQTTYHWKTDCTIGPPPCLVEFEKTRLQSITNNRGYQLKFSYASNDVSSADWLKITGVAGINNAIDYCAPDADTCPTFSRTWPSVTYNYTPTLPRPISTTDQSGRTTTYTYGSYGLVGIQFPGSSIDDISATYNSAGQVTALTDAGGSWTYSYSTSGSTGTVVASGPLSQQLTVVTDLTTSRLSSLTDALSRTWSYQYDANLRMTRLTQPEGNYVGFAYDGRGNPTQSTFVPKPGSGLPNIVTSTTYPSSCSNPATCNRPTSTTDARGGVTDYSWDGSHGGLLSVTLPAPASGADRPQTRFVYDAFQARYKDSATTYINGLAIFLPVKVSACVTGTSCSGAANEVQANTTWPGTSSANNLLPIAVSRGSGATPTIATVATTWTPDGDVETVDGPLAGVGDTTRYRYDSARQMVGMVGPDPDGAGSLLNRAQRLTYSTRGQVTLSETGTTPGYTDANWSSFNPLVRSATVYDDRGRPLVTSQQSGAGTTVGVQQVSYDASGRPGCTAVRTNPAAWGSLPTSACTATTAGSDGPDRITLMAYDAAGRPSSMTTAYGLAEAASTSLTYTVNGQAASLSDGNNNVSVQEYDGFDRPVTLRYPNPAGGGTSTTDYEQVAYDAYGRRNGSRNRAGQVTTLTLDNLGRVMAVDAPSGTMDVAYTYDNLGRVLTATGNGQTLTNAWDPLSRLTSETGPLGAMSYQYDAASRMTRITWPDAFYAQYDHDLYGAITAIRENGATSGIGVLATYAHNDLGQPTGITRGNGAGTNYGYDAAARMTSMAHDAAGSIYDVTFGFSYNPAGQIAARTVSNAAYVYAPATGSTSYANDGLNAVTSVGGGSVTYDANHNITGALGATYAYDASSRLTSTASTSFGYDPAGRLFSISSAGIRRQYAGQQAVGDYDSAGNMLTRHVPGPGLDLPVTTHYGSGLSTRMWMMTDERQSVISLTDSSASTLNINRYDEYGAPAPGNSDLFQYTGQTYLAPGLYHYRARVYAPQLGRFLQTDRIGYAAGTNLYAYVSNDPLNWTDPAGLQQSPQGGPPSDIGPVDVFCPPNCEPRPRGGGLGPSFKLSGLMSDVTFEEVSELSEVLVFGSLQEEELGEPRVYGSRPACGECIMAWGLGARFGSRGFRGTSFYSLMEASERIGQALKPDRFHQLMNNPVLQQNVARLGQRFNIRGGDGNTYTLYQASGGVGRHNGVFEYIVNSNRQITHQTFVPNGRITGQPNGW